MNLSRSSWLEVNEAHTFAVSGLTKIKLQRTT